MIIIIQIAVIIMALTLLLSTLVGRQTHAARAWKKIALCLLACAMVVAVLFPDITNQLAHLVGVGRGADLLLYVLVLAFIAYALNSYIHQQREKDVLYRLARKVALLEANEQYNIK
ncbi:MAG TPA: DUF2304 domain-containing protein [Candidatus Saccharimonadales bacterium]|nr:DUF2304 domain-containing protein [Candidatus Saccharimonadales bacterium]